MYPDMSERKDVWITDLFHSLFSRWRKFWWYSVNFACQLMTFLYSEPQRENTCSTLIRSCQPLGTPCLKWAWSTQYYQSSQFREWRWFSVGINVQSTPCKVPSLLATIANRHRYQFFDTDRQVRRIDLLVQTDKEVFNVSILYFLKGRLTPQTFVKIFRNVFVSTAAA